MPEVSLAPAHKNRPGTWRCRCCEWPLRNSLDIAKHLGKWEPIKGAGRKCREKDIAFDCEEHGWEER